MINKALATGALALFTLTSTVVGASAAGPVSPSTLPPAPAAIVAPAAIAPADALALQYMREEEKLAHDVYVALYDEWGLRVFDNISASEQQHTDRVAYWLEYYGVADPTQGNGPGEFTDPKLQDLYDTLVSQGEESVVAALEVGAAIEEIDILDLRERLDATQNSALQNLFTNLERGSNNHLRAFVSNLEAQGGATYVPQYLSQADYDEIVDAAGAGRGRGAAGGGYGRRGGGRP